MVAVGEETNGRRTRKKSRSHRRALLPLGFALLAALVVAVPEAMLAIGTRNARRCLETYEAPRGPVRPACGDTIKGLLFPASVPWTSTRARYRAEELNARIAVLDYMDATVSVPDEDAQTKTAKALDHASQVVRDGSQRLAIDDLGRSLATPELGRDADELGDRRTLLGRGDMWLDWRVRLSALRSALLAADSKRAEELARKYSDYDPRDQDIRTAIGAVLCLGDDPSRGLAMLPMVQDDRASRRYEGMARDFGELRGLVVACAARANEAPPPAPENPQAGRANAMERRALLRIRLATTRGTAEAGRAAIQATKRLLEGPRSPGARVALLAAVLAASPELDAAEVARLAHPQGEETPLAAPLTETAVEWLSERRPSLGDADPTPILPGATFVSAARAIAAVEELAAVRGALWLEAAAALAREGDVEGGTRAADEAASALALRPEVRGLLRSNVSWLGGDREKAFAELDAGASLPARHDNGKATGEVVSGVAQQQRAELALSLGKREEALASAERALSGARAERDVALEARASWMLAALGRRAANLPPWPDIEAGVAFPWVGFANPLAPWQGGTEAQRTALVERALGPWVGLASADAVSRRAARWAALRDRGDAPPWLSLHALLGGRLLGPSEGDVEVWLDAFLAFDARRFSLRSYSFARAEAARMRGDFATAERWDARYRFLRGLATDPSRIELARHLDL